MKKKTLTIAIALVLVVALAVGATWAYLTAQSGPVVNTFTVGKLFDQGGALTLKEHKAASILTRSPLKRRRAMSTICSPARRSKKTRLLRSPA